MNFNNTRFVTSAAALADCPADSLAEVCFAGRSNAGKSSAINAITGHRKLARISKTPGRTRLINFFAVTAGLYLVDLPGYGFARAPLAVKQTWQAEMERYLSQRQALTGLVLLSDVRHPLQASDQLLLHWAVQAELPVLLLLTKADKLKRGAAASTRLQVDKAIAGMTGSASVATRLFSAVNRQGVEQAQQVIAAWLQPDADQ